MLGLPRKSDKPVVPISRELERENARLDMVNRARGVLRLMMIGPQMVLIPLPEHDKFMGNFTPRSAAKK